MNFYWFNFCFILIILVFFCEGRSSYDLETEETEKPATYAQKILVKDENAEKESKFSETDTATVVRRSHVRVDLPAAGLGHRPPSVVSSDQEYPSLEHKEIPVPSPFVKRMQQTLEQAKSKSPAKTESKSNLDTKTSIKDQPLQNMCTTNPSQDGIYRFQQAAVTNFVSKENQSCSQESNVSQSEVLQEKVPSVDLQSQKTVVNAKNDQIKVSVQEKLAKNKEEVSGKRSSFTDLENKTDYLDKFNSSTNQYSDNATNQSSNLYKEPSNEENVVNDKHPMFNLLPTSDVGTERVSEVTEQIMTKIDSSISSGFDNEPEVSVQPQTTWEQEKQKAEMAKLRQSENSLFPANTVGDKTQVKIPSPLKKDLLEDQKLSDNSLIEDSDSSDAKTITNLESLTSMETQTLNGSVNTPAKLNSSHVVPVTPDTMTPDEAENLLSSR